MNVAQYVRRNRGNVGRKQEGEICSSKCRLGPDEVSGGKNKQINISKVFQIRGTENIYVLDFLGKT